MTRRLALLRMLGLLPATRYGSMGQMHRRPDQQTDAPSSAVAPTQAAGVVRARLVLIFGSGPNSGLFVYSGTPAKGHLVAEMSAPGVTQDPYGNAIPTSGIFNAGTWNASGVLTSHFGINNVGDTFLANAAGLTVVHERSSDGSVFYYNTSGEGAGNLLASYAPAATTDGPGNAILAGDTVYGAAGGTQLAMQATSNGGLTFLSAATQAGPWTRNATFLIDSSGNLAMVTGITLTHLTGLSLQAGSRVTVQDGNDGNTYSVERLSLIAKNVSQLISSTTPATITGLSWTLGIGTYRIRARLICTQGLTLQSQNFRFTGSGGLTVSAGRITATSLGAASTVIGVSTVTALATDLASGAFAAGVTWVTNVDGWYQTSAGGTIALQASDGAAGNQFTVVDATVDVEPQ